MEQFSITKTETGFQIEGFPDAAKVIQIEGPKTKRLADLSLHKSDLEFAFECLETINQVSDKPWVLRQALWRSAIIHYIKCFGDNEARFLLNSKKTYKGNAGALTAFDYFKDLRNKHVAHDDNSYAQSIPCAILNKPDKSYKIKKILCFSAIGETLEQGNWKNLHLLIQTARKWVVVEFDKLCETITKELEAKPYEDLNNLEPVTYTVPKIDDLKKNRNAP